MAELKPGPLPPTIAGLKPEPKTRKKKTWTDELNELGNFLLGPHQAPLIEAGTLAAQFTPGAEIQEALESSATISSGVQNMNPWETGIGLAGILASFVPGPSGVKEMPFVHGSQHKFKSEGNHALGKFDNSKALSGEGTNYEGAGTYLTDPTAEEIAQYYAAMGPSEAKVSIGNKDLDELFTELRKEYNTVAYGGPADKSIEKLKNKFESVEQLQEETARVATAFQGLNSGADTIELPDSEVAKLIDNVIGRQSIDTLFMESDDGVEAVKGMDEEILSFLNSFKGKGATIKQPGGYIYDVYGDMAPEDFLHMHMPITYQDDKVISAVDEWLKNMPVDRLANTDYLRKGTQGYRDQIRKKVIDDKYHVPYKSLVPILGDQYAPEHAAILKDLGLPGQKWFSSYADGRQRRRDSYDLFEQLSGNKTLESRSNDLRSEIAKLDKFVNETPLTNETTQQVMEAYNKQMILQNQLEALGGNKFKDVEASLYNLYNRDPVYNYVVNDPQRLTITGRKFQPKGRRY